MRIKRHWFKFRKPSMTQSSLPLLVESVALEQSLGAENLLIVDLCRPEIYSQQHVPGAVHFDFAQIVTAKRPAMGLLPDEKHLSKVLSAIGLTPESHVVAYDDEGGGRASRFLWTLDVIGHNNFSLLNGGLHAWAAEQRPSTNEATEIHPTNYEATITHRGMADKNYILRHLKDPSVVLVDTRSPAEYTGESKKADRAGHIPGAVNFDWVNAMDQQNHLRLKPQDELRSVFNSLGSTPDKEVITYCQTHHRSAHTYMVFKILGYKNVKGYPGSWSEWGNSKDTPVE